MYSLHLTGNPWFLLLIPPGLWILLRQYRGQAGAAAYSRAGILLFALQGFVLALLAFSLTAPELRRHRIEFHNPAVILLRDRSAGFQAGGYLGLGGRYREFERALVKTYADRKFDVRVADFSATAWPVSGFPDAGRGGAAAAEAGERAGLTSLASLSDFLDSAAIPNLRAAFLFSDGRANLDSGRAPPNWKVPLYPVVFEPDSIGEAQPERVRLSTGGAGGALEAEAWWRWVGAPGGSAVLKLEQGGKTLLTRKLEGSRGGMIQSRFAWNPGKAVTGSREPLRAVLEPSRAGANFDPYNDTVEVAFPQGRALRRIHVLRPLRSLDEKGMMDILEAWEGTRVSFFDAADAGKLGAAAEDQVWMEAGALREGRLAERIRKTPAKVVVYSLPDADRNPRTPGLSDAPRLRFTPGAEIKPGHRAADAFPSEIVRLKGLTVQALEVPEAPGMAWVEIREDGKRGMLMGRIPLGGGKRAFYFALPAIWRVLFDPQVDFAVRENVEAYIKAAHALAGLEDGAVRISHPARAYHRVPFDLEIRVPGNASRAAPWEFTLTGPEGATRRWTRADADTSADGAAELAIKGIALPRGRYRLEVRAGSERLRADSLVVAPAEALELARIGFDREALGEAASRSGGTMIVPEAGSSVPAEVASMLPTLPAAQIRMERTESIRLYNTLSQCLLALALLFLSWLLRKKWDMD